MKQGNGMTDREIQRLSREASYKGLGMVGLIQRIQKVDNGCGDYVKDRQAWQKGYSVDMLLEAVKREQ